MSDMRVVAPTSRRYTKAQREQAVRLVRQIREETGERHGAVQRVARQLGYGVETVRKWVNQADVMTLHAEVKDGGSADLASAVEASIQNLCKVRGKVKFVTPGSLANDGKVIDDIRKYE